MAYNHRKSLLIPKVFYAWKKNIYQNIFSVGKIQVRAWTKKSLPLLNTAQNKSWPIAQEIQKLK